MFPLFLSLFLGIAAPRLKAEEPGGNGVAAFSDPARIWGNGVERVIEEAYRQSFKTYIIDGKVMNLRMPFAQNNERSELSGKNWQFLGGGKADPGYLWEAIGSVLAGEDFRRYAEVLADGREKVIIFDIPSQTWTASRDLFDLSRMKAGSYRGLPHRPYVLVSGRGIEEPDVYNYLYCIGWVGMDCSGFVWHVLTYVAQAGGLNLGRALSRALGISGNQSPSLYAGTSFFNSGDREIIAVQDEIRNLRPADIILFRAPTAGLFIRQSSSRWIFPEGLSAIYRVPMKLPLMNAALTNLLSGLILNIPN